MDDDMLEAHVAFELAAWTDELAGTLSEMLSTTFAWLDGVSLGSVFSDADLQSLIDGLPIPDVSAAVLAVHAEALTDGTPLEDLVDREDFDEMAATVSTMADLQDAIIEQVTTSEVYADLISHVLLHGIRNYVTTESPLARVPGASSLMRMGQSAFDTAAPGLSKGIEKQLTGFVSANLQDTLRESRQYLGTVIDADALTEVAADVWERNKDRTVAELAELLPEDVLAELTQVGQRAAGHLIQTPSFHAAVRAVLDANASRPVGDLLVEAGITVDLLIDHSRPWILRAADDGILEAVIRQRLEAFYSAYEG